MDPNKLNALKVPELKKELEDRGLSSAGLKAELVERLKAALESSAGQGPGEQPSTGGIEAVAAAGQVSSAASASGADSVPADDSAVVAPAVDEAPAAPVETAPSAEQAPAAAPLVGATAGALAETAAANGAVSQAPTQQSDDASGATADQKGLEGDSAPAQVGTKRDASAMGDGSQQAPAKKPAATLPHDPNLPAPWQAFLSQRTGKTYWFNPDTKETTWIYPGPRAVAAPAPAAVQASRGASFGGAPAQGSYPSSGGAQALGAYPAYQTGAPVQGGQTSGLVPAVNAGTGQLPIRPGAVKCKHFLKFGQCKFGQECRFDHPPDEAGKDFDPAAASARTQERPSMLPNGLAQTGGLPVRPNEKECSFFMKTGMCKYGSSCRWHHPAERQSADVKYIKPEDTGAPGAGAAAMSGANEWEMHMSDMGRPYYYNTRTQESTWEPPPTMMNSMMSMMGGMMGMPNMGGVGGGMAMAAAAGVGAGGGGGRAAAPEMTGLAGGLHPIRPGATDCSFYLKTGSCKFGESCKFNHPPEMLGTGSLGMKPTGATPGAPVSGGFKKVEIRSEMSTMVCGPGGLPRPAASPSAERTAEGYPVRPGMPDCTFYMKTGHCKFMDTCKFNHPHKGITGLPDASGMAKAMGFAGMGM